MTGPSSDPELRIKALEQVLVEKGYVDPAALDVIAETYERNIGPHNGARVVARAWSDPDYRKWLLADGTAAIASFGYSGRGGETIRAVENTSGVHNVIVCTLCSCTAFTIIGLPPDWYKDLDYRARAVRESRTVLREMGLDLPSEIEIRVWDTTADTRYMVLPVQPPATVGWPEERLVDIVTKESMIGVARL
jgi:nitrile hydratase